MNEPIDSVVSEVHILAKDADEKANASELDDASVKQVSEAGTTIASNDSDEQSTNQSQAPRTSTATTAATRSFRDFFNRLGKDPAKEEISNMTEEDKELKRKVLKDQLGLKAEQVNGEQSTNQSQAVLTREIELRRNADNEGVASHDAFTLSQVSGGGTIRSSFNQRRVAPTTRRMLGVDYQSMTVSQLKEILSRKGLKVSGRKAILIDLIERLEPAERFEGDRSTFNQRRATDRRTGTQSSNTGRVRRELNDNHQNAERNQSFGLRKVLSSRDVNQDRMSKALDNHHQEIMGKIARLEQLILNLKLDIQDKDDYIEELEHKLDEKEERLRAVERWSIETKEWIKQENVTFYSATELVE